MSEFHHKPVLLKESLEMMNLDKDSTVIDCTGGGGGHSAGFADLGGRVIALDRDPIAVAHLIEKFKNNDKVSVEHRTFSTINKITLTSENRISIFADLGVSSPQLDSSERGFSFLHEGPLDMRMNQEAGGSAADLIEHSTYPELTTILSNFGDEPKAHLIAKLILANKPFRSTKELADLIADKGPYPKHESRNHPATRTFMALRMAVNNELEEVETLLTEGFKILSPGCRMGIITFHSIEDRMVKNKFKKWSGKLPDPNLRHLPMEEKPLAKIIKPFPQIPSEQESKQNVRSRSAKLRVIEKL